MENKINQKINGDGNVQQQIQHQTVNIITAELTESQIRDISSKNALEIAKTYFETAVEIANTRMKCLEDIVMNRFNKIENSLIAFSDPSFFYRIEVLKCLLQQQMIKKLMRCLVNYFYIDILEEKTNILLLV